MSGLGKAGLFVTLMLAAGIGSTFLYYAIPNSPLIPIVIVVAAVVGIAALLPRGQHR